MAFDPRLAALLSDAQDLLQSGVRPERVDEIIASSDVTQHLPPEHRNMRFLQEHAGGVENPGPLRQAQKQADDMLWNGASMNEVQEFLKEATGGDYSSLGEINRALTPVSETAIEEIQQENARREDTREAARRRLGDSGPVRHGADLAKQALRGFPFLGEAAAQGSANITAGVPAFAGALLQGEGLEGATDAAEEATASSQQRQRDFQRGHPLQSIGAQVAGAGAGTAALLRGAGFAGATGAQNLMSGRGPNAPGLFGRGPAANPMLETGTRSGQLREAAANLPVDASGTLKPLVKGVAGESFKSIGRGMGLFGAENVSQQIGRGEGSLLDRVKDVSPGEALFATAIGGFAGAAGGATNAFSRTGENVRAIKMASPERVARSVENRFGTLNRSGQVRKTRAEVQRIRDEFYKPLEASGPLRGEHIRRVVEDDSTAPYIQKALSRRVDDVREDTPIHFNDLDDAAKRVQRDIETARSNNEWNRVGDLEIVKRRLHNAMDEAFEFGEDAAGNPLSFTKQARDEYRAAARPQEIFESGFNSGKADAETLRIARMEFMDDAGSVVDEVGDEMFRAGVARRQIDEWKGSGRLRPMTDNERQRMAISLGYDDLDHPAFREFEGIVNAELNSRVGDKAVDNIIKYGSFTLMGSSVLGGTALSFTAF